ncbi:helix-turn-helix domain-containing protein [Hymenobacter lutimineralis]|uniref:Helix-turn-helix domain-containing protein n=1 Tax=Hymenobacter lutimineralis TaxID=2606448 RepID=A0A5D6VBY9_9BACT|nr:helix-turn-helix domain-containing protein [Hymenobacter lutimineralis]TYZ12722.1 helix-turn-helix domain-containing protein [Hymenobacter lutimineralis]
MQLVAIIPEAEWNRVLGRLDTLEAAEAARTLATTAQPDEILTTDRAAAYIGLSVCALLRARRAGRIQGVRLNERDWGFRKSVLDAYPRRYHRPTMPVATA